jgi:hypothetical protein
MPGFHDIRQLAYLNDIEGVQFELYGGAAFRFALQQDRGDAVVDLFDLAPFTTDIDLVHLGSTTPRVFQQILKHVPNADCFRWRIRSQSERPAGFWANIPARQISLTAQSINNPTSGLEDIRYKRFRFYPDRSSSHLEVLAALLYVQTLFEADLTREQLLDQPGMAAARDVFFQAAEDPTIAVLERDSYLRSQFTHLLLSCISSAPPDIFRDIAEACGLRRFLSSIIGVEGFTRVRGLISRELREYLLLTLLHHSPEGIVLSPSAPLRAGRYRLPLATGHWVAGSSAIRRFEETGVDLAPRQQILLASPIMQVAAGGAPAAADADVADDARLPAWFPFRLYRSNATYRQEFIYFQLPSEVYGALEFDDRDLSILAAVRPWWSRALKRRWSLFALPVVVQRRRSGAGYRLADLSVRANTLGLFGALARLPGAQAQFFVVGMAE